LPVYVSASNSVVPTSKIAVPRTALRNMGIPPRVGWVGFGRNQTLEVSKTTKVPGVDYYLQIFSNVDAMGANGHSTGRGRTAVLWLNAKRRRPGWHAPLLSPA
jgi:hypothetical protein